MEPGIKYEMESVANNDTNNQMVHVIKKEKKSTKGQDHWCR